MKTDLDLPGDKAATIDRDGVFLCERDGLQLSWDEWLQLQEAIEKWIVANKGKLKGRRSGGLLSRENNALAPKIPALLAPLNRRILVRRVSTREDLELDAAAARRAIAQPDQRPGSIKLRR